MTQQNRRRADTAAYVVIGIIVTLWAGANVLDAIVPTYEPPDSINQALLIILGPLVGSLLVRGKPAKDDDETGGDDR